MLDGDAPMEGEAPPEPLGSAGKSKPSTNIHECHEWSADLQCRDSGRFVYIRGHPRSVSALIERSIKEYSAPARTEARPPARRCSNGGRGSARAVCLCWRARLRPSRWRPAQKTTIHECTRIPRMKCQSLLQGFVSIRVDSWTPPISLRYPTLSPLESRHCQVHATLYSISSRRNSCTLRLSLGVFEPEFARHARQRTVNRQSVKICDMTPSASRRIHTVNGREPMG